MNLAPPTTEWSDAVLAVLERQEALVAELDRLSESQGALIRPDGGAALLELLTRRQHLLDALTATQRVLDERIGELRQRPEVLSAPVRERIRTVVGRVETCLAAVLERDERDGAAISRARDEAARAIGAVGSAQQVRRAYAAPPPAESRFADREG